MSNTIIELPTARTLADTVSTARAKGTDFAERTLPRIGDLAQRSSRSVANFITTTGEAAGRALHHQETAQLARIGLSLGTMRLVRRRVGRLVMRHPLLTVAGGVIAAGAGIALYRKTHQADDPAAKDGAEAHATDAPKSRKIDKSLEATKDEALERAKATRSKRARA